MGDHVHMMLSIPPKYSVSGVVGYIKAKNFVGLNFWARAITCRRWGGTRRRCEITSESKRKKIVDSIN